MKSHSFYSIFSVLMLVIAFQANALNYYINFTGSGASTTLDSVVVQNLYKGTQVTVTTASQLRLYDMETSIDRLNTIVDFAGVYPNPMTDNATFSFVSKHGGNTKISVFTLEGKKVAGLDLHLREGKNTFELTLPKGVYLVQAKGTGFSYTVRTISLSMSVSRPKLIFSENMPDNMLRKVATSEVKLQYTPGDQLLYKGYSGNFCTIVTDKPSESKTTDFKFVDCTDADGNHYAVVHIGEQTWMAENLKTTKYRNEESIPNVTDNAAWGALTTGAWCHYFNNAENDVKYGKLYNWYAINDSRKIAPEGWHVPTEVDWSTLENYLIANGFNYDGTTIGNKIPKALAANFDWNSSSGEGTIGNDLTKNNSSGFSGLPGGYRDLLGAFVSPGNNCIWWSHTESDEINAWSRYLYLHFNYVISNVFPKTYGFSVRCVKDELPTLTTTAITNIKNTTATSGGEITNEGFSAVTARGVCWSKNHNPTIEDSKTIDGAGTGSFTSNITGLISGETYYVRAYATNNNGTAYGNELSFTTAIKDIDGNVYTTVTIGTQTWIVENLKTTKYRNGEEIGTTIPSNFDISAETEPKYQWAYNGDENNVPNFGRLYTWYAVTDARNIAPEGWHVASDEEWTILENYLIANGFNYDGTTTDNKIAKALAATTDWNSSTNIGAIGNDLTKNNTSGITALPGGFRYYFGLFEGLQNIGYWWSSTTYDTGNALRRRLIYDNNNLDVSYSTKTYGFSVRCVRDY